MAGADSETLERDEAIVAVMSPDADQIAVVGDDAEVSPPRPRRPKSPRRWGWTAVAALQLVVGVAVIVQGTTSLFDRYLPELSDIRSVDGDPPSIFVQFDSPSNAVSETIGETLQRVTSWPTVLIAPIALAALLGLLVGWVRWRWGRAWKAERLARKLEVDAQRMVAHDLEKTMRLDTMLDRFNDARTENANLRAELERLGAGGAVALQSTLELRTREVSRLSSDLEDALAERDHLENKVEQLKADLGRLTDQSADTADAFARLDAAVDLVEQQRRKIASLENHLDQVRRRVAELSEEAKNATQLRAAWAQAEDIIADLTHQLAESERGQHTFRPETAASIVGATSRVADLEGLLNEAADVIEGTQAQLRATRVQVRELDAALARAEAREQSKQTEIDLLTSEIDQAAVMIARLQELPDQQRRTEVMLDEMRAALESERDRNASLERQLRTVNARAHRLETHLLGDRAVEPVLDLTEDATTPVV